jgi:squalene-hopene/tetraprenyl-beta-curcumene cyclase
LTQLTQTREAQPHAPPREGERRALEEAIEATQNHLLARQNPAGYWVGELEADASVTAGYIPLMVFMTGRVDPARQQKVINFVRSKQRPDGSWGAYCAGPGDLNVSIQVYFALKLAGIPAEEPFMRRARTFILDQGGIGKANVFTRVWLALFGQFDWGSTPSIPPEVILLPNRSFVNIYEFASWSRETIVALTVLLAQKPVCQVPAHAGVSELYVEPEGRRSYEMGNREGLFNWKSVFLALDAVFKGWEKLPVKPGRGLALRRAERWIVAHQEADGSWGGIMLPWIYSLFALKSLGYGPAHPVIERGLAGLEDFIVEDDVCMRLQPAVSPVWDTAWAVLALRESGLPADHPALQKAARWLLEQEIRVPGDWRVKNPTTEPGGWAFEFENDLYPDLDDTPVVVRALRQVRLSEEEEPRKARAVDRALRWVVDMQSKDGGWAAFDRDNDKQILGHIPFADFMSPLDPTCPDVTAHVVECLSDLDRQGTPLRKAMDYLRGAQESDGAWYGRWGVNYIYGTGLALAGLDAAGQAPEQDTMQRGSAWLTSNQNADGGWGETCHTYADPAARGEGRSTASQTAWALMGLLAAGKTSDEAIERGIAYLLRTHQPDGSWQEEAFTGTGFPRAFYLRYDLYRIYFPLMALARCRDRAPFDSKMGGSG